MKTERVSRRIFGPKWEEVAAGLRSFIMCTLLQMDYYGSHIKEE